MSDTQSASEQRITRSNFASRMLSKELDNRNKTTQSMKIISPADAAKYANQETEAETSKESVTVS